MDPTIRKFNLFIIHANCMDGHGAMAVPLVDNVGIKTFFELDILSGDYSQPIPLDKYEDKDVCFLDYSLKASEMLKVLEVAKSVTVIDHHVSVHEELSNIIHPNFNYVYDVDLSGAQLAWRFWFPDTPEPKIISLIGDRDLWKKRFVESDVLNLAMRTENYTFHEIHRIITSDVSGNELLDALINRGHQYEIYHRKLVKDIASHAWVDRLDDDSDTEVLRVNCPLGFMSDVGALLSEQSPSGVAWLYYDLEEETKHSLRVSTESTYDAGEFCKSKGGGGHKKAAGWTDPRWVAVNLADATGNASLTITGDTSDGYHTFNELYDHRMVLFSVICNQNDSLAWKSWLHSDGTMFDDYFIVGVTTPEGEYTYHYHKDHWDKFNIKVVENAPTWDGHVASDITRLNSIVKRRGEVIRNPLA